MLDKIDKLTVDALTEDQVDVAELIGLEAYKKLLRYYPGGSIYIPKLTGLDLLERDQKIKSEFAKGVSARKLALQYNLSVNWIRKIIYGRVSNSKTPFEDQIDIESYLNDT